MPIDPNATVRDVTVQWSRTTGPAAGVVRQSTVSLIEGYTDETSIPAILAIAYTPSREFADEIKVHAVFPKTRP